jgi:hypothetical protein
LVSARNNQEKMMITIQELRADEKEAIKKYTEFLRQEPHSLRIISLINQIKRDKERHLRMLKD